MPILPQGSNLNELATPDVYVIEDLAPSVIGERTVRVLGLIGDFTFGPELEQITIGDETSLIKTFGSYSSSMKGYLDAYTILKQGCRNLEIVKAKPQDGDPVAAYYTITNQHYTQTDAGSILKFYSYVPTSESETIEILIETGSVSGSKITITDGITPEVYDNVDMDETVSASYIVDEINSNSLLVRVERLSELTDDTLPTNQVSTQMSSVENIDVIKLTAKTEGLNGNSIVFSISEGSNYTKNITITDLITEETEVYSNLNMDSSVPSTYIVDYITANSSFVSIERVDDNNANLIPRNVNTPYISLENGSDGGLKYASIILKDDALNNIAKLEAKYRGSHGNNISIKVTNNDTYINVEIADPDGNVQKFRNLTMNSTSSNYLINKINNSLVGAYYVTCTRMSGIEDDTLPASLSYTNMTGGSDGDPIDDVAIQEAIGVFDTSDYIDIITIGSQSNGTDNANALYLKSQCEVRRDRICIINSNPSSTENEAIDLASELRSQFVVLTHPEQYILNPITRLKEVIAYAPSYAGRLSMLSYEISPTRNQILYTLGNTRKLSSSGNNAVTDALTVGGVSPIAFNKGLGSYVIVNGTTTNGDEVSIVSMRYYIARTCDDILQEYVGKPNTEKTREQVRNKLENFLQRLLRQEKIGSTEGTEDTTYKVICDTSNNPQEIVRQRTLIAQVYCVLLVPANHVVVKLQAGASVSWES